MKNARFKPVITFLVVSREWAAVRWRCSGHHPGMNSWP
jgi:hypothetical protein